MALPARTKLGPYEIVSPLGVGGMGEVYRATDTRLGRDVAIKVLPESFASDPKFRERFEREARAISSLQHPHICVLHDVGSQQGIDFLVLEYLEGETLAARLRKGPLPTGQVLKYGIQIADALDKAHLRGITHRDLKPGNVMLTKSGVKLLDFGLAKPVKMPVGSAALDAMTHTPTASFEPNPITSEGTLIGTFQYMSPEQLDGKEADARSDIFALGCVLYEMATGKRAFDGKTTASVVAAILASEPKPITQLLPASPPALDHLVKRCLAKDPDERWQSARDLFLELKSVSESSGVAVWPGRGARIFRTYTAAATAAALLFAAAAAIGWLHRPAEKPFQFIVQAPEKTSLNMRGLAGPPAISPDGFAIAFVAAAEGQAGNRSLWLRSLDSAIARQVTGSDGAMFPFWSPDSRFVGFFAGGKLMRLEASSGTLLAVSDVAEGRGGAWSENGYIVFGIRDGPLYKVSASGGQPVQLTTLDKGRNETSHRWPVLLPDGAHVFYVSQAPEVRVFVTSLKTGERRMLATIETNAAFAEGNLLYVREGALLAQPFSQSRLNFTGEPVMVAEHVQTDSQFNFAVFHASGPVLVYQTGALEAGTQLVLADRSGKETPISTETELRIVLSPALAPAGDRLLVDIEDSSGKVADISMYNLARNTKTRITFDQRSFGPIWSPDGQRFAFLRNTSEGHELIIKNASGGVETVILKSGKLDECHAWSPDGRYILCEIRPPQIWAVPLAGDHKPIVVLPEGRIMGTFLGPALSPDGNWLAYDSSESGVEQVYVVPFRPESGAPADSLGKWQVSSGGGMRPQWSADGKELFFANTSGTTLFSARIRASKDQFESDTPVRLFNLRPHPYARQFYAPARDGQHFYISFYSQGSLAPLTVSVNWKGLLKK